jgi:hypothetical protein
MHIIDWSYCHQPLFRLEVCNDVHSTAYLRLLATIFSFCSLLDPQIYVSSLHQFSYFHGYFHVVARQTDGFDVTSCYGDEQIPF